MTFCLVFWFLVFGYWVFQKKICVFYQCKDYWLSYEVAFFLHYGWFLQNLGEDFIPTNMHTTVRLLGPPRLA